MRRPRSYGRSISRQPAIPTAIIHINASYPCFHCSCSHQCRTNSLFPRWLFTSTRRTMSSMRLQNAPRSQHRVARRLSSCSLSSMIVSIIRSNMSENHQFSNISFYPRPNSNSSCPTLLSNIIGVHASFIPDQKSSRENYPRCSS